MAEHMREMAKSFAKKFHRDQDGATAVEYGLMVALIAAVIIAAVSLLGTSTRDCFTTVGNAISGSTGGTANCAAPQ